jgi:hypothetical protein
MNKRQREAVRKARAVLLGIHMFWDEEGSQQPLHPGALLFDTEAVIREEVAEAVNILEDNFPEVLS